MKRWILLGSAVFGIACLAQTIATPVPVVTVITELPGTPYATPGCQPASGVTFKLQKISDTLVEVIASGLQPGETPYVYYQTDGKGGGFPGNVVDKDGTFYSDLNWTEWSNTAILEPPQGKTSAMWDFRLVHAHGVECATITLP